MISRPMSTFTICAVLYVWILHIMCKTTLAPIRHMSLAMCDCIISAMSWEWLDVLMNAVVLLGGRGSLVPAGHCSLMETKHNHEKPTASLLFQICRKIFV